LDFSVPLATVWVKKCGADMDALGFTIGVVGPAAERMPSLGSTDVLALGERVAGGIGVLDFRRWSATGRKCKLGLGSTDTLALGSGISAPGNCHLDFIASLAGRAPTYWCWISHLRWSAFGMNVLE
jgi:hypothetical protein